MREVLLSCAVEPNETGDTYESESEEESTCYGKKLSERISKKEKPMEVMNDESGEEMKEIDIEKDDGNEEDDKESDVPEKQPEKIVDVGEKPVVRDFFQGHTKNSRKAGFLI